MDDKQIDEMWLALYKQERYLMPWSSGEYMVYHNDSSRLAFRSYGVDPRTHYEIIRPRKFKLKLFYEESLVKLAKIIDFKKDSFVEIPMTIKLEDYFEIKDWRGRKIPTALKRFETEYKVERLFNLFVFT